MSLPITSTYFAGIHCRVPLDPVELQRREPIVCLHGLGGSGRQLLPLASAFGEHLAPILVDLPGHGSSQLSCDCRPAGVVRSLIAVLHVFSPVKPVWLFGHSLGGLVALKMATQYPRLFAGLILVATTPQARLHPDMLERATTNRFDLDWVRRCVGPELDEDGLRLLLEDFNHLQWGRKDFEAWMQIDLRPRLASIVAPVLIVQPTSDVIISPRRSTALARALPKARLLPVIGAGHYVTLTRPSLLGRAVACFVDETPAICPEANLMPQEVECAR